MKTSELIGAQLDYWVAKADGVGAVVRPLAEVAGAMDFCVHAKSGEPFAPSCNWHQGGPVIERERISLRKCIVMETAEPWVADIPDDDLSTGVNFCGPTPLIAAMRAYVASKFGEEVVDKP